MEFLDGGSTGPEISNELEHNSNFFIGSSPEDWVVDVPNCEKVAYGEVWENIDIFYRIDKGRIKYDIIVKPGGRVEDIGFRFTGAKPSVRGGSLFLDTPFGTVIDDAPVSFQEGREIGSWWLIDDNGDARFGIRGHDPSKELLIDPGLRFSSFAGGSSADRGRALAVDSQGYVYVTGYTASSTFPTTTGAFDTGFNGGSSGDAFVLKLNVSGDTLIYSTFLGGSQNDYGLGIDIDSLGSAYIAGQTFSNNFPVQSGFDTAYANSGDVFVTKLSTRGNSISYSTYLGGWAQEIANDIKVQDRYAYVTGSTSFVNNGWPAQWKYPTTNGAYDTTHNGNEDAFVTKLSQNGQSLSYSTFIGDSQNEYGRSIDVDSSGSAFVTGSTTSSSFPTSSGAYDRNYGGNEDAFLLKVSASGNSLLFSTFLGGTGYERAYGVEIDPQGDIYTTGETGSSNFPTTTNAYDGSYGGSNDAFLTLFDSTGASILNSTFLGGSGQDVGRSVVMGPNGLAHVIGSTYSSNYPTTSDAFSTTIAGSSDIFVSKLDIGGAGMDYSTYIGGTNNDEGLDIYVDSLGFIYLTGQSNSNDYPTTYIALDGTHNSNDDVIITKFYPADFSPSNLVAKEGYFHVNISWSAPTTPIVSTYPVMGYNIYRGTSQNALAPLASVGIINYFNDTINDFTSRTYYYFVTAILTTLGESGETNLISSTPFVTPPPFDPVPVGGDLFVNLTWNVIGQEYLDIFEIDYMVYRGLSASSLQPLARVGEIGYYNDTDVPRRPTRFYYRVSYEVLGVGESNSTNVILGIPNTPPGEPEELTIEGLNRAFNVSWSPPADDGGYPVLGYTLYRGETPDLMVSLAELSPTETKYIDEGIVPGSVHFYTVAASNTLGPSVVSEPLEATGQTVPSSPRDLNLVPLDQRVRIEWKAPELDWGIPVEGYSIYRGTEAGEMSLVQELDDGYRTFTDTVTNGIGYFYSVIASNIHGEGDPAGPLETMATGIPGVVRNASFEIGDGAVTLFWEPPSTDGGLRIETYRVYRGTDIDSLDTEFVLASNAGTFKDGGLENGVTYYYKITSSNSKGESAPSAAIIATPGRVPDRISQLVVQPGLESATLTWTNPEDLGGREGLNIQLYRGTSVSSMSPQDTIPFIKTSYTDKGLIPGKVYYYALTVINPLGEGARSPAVSTIVLGPPSAPAISSFESGAHTINLSWVPPLQDGGVPLTGYTIEIRQEGDIEWDRVYEEGNDHEFFGLSQGMTYDLRVRAVNSLTEGPPTDIVKILVGEPPEEPRDLRVESLKPEVRVKWSPRPQIALPVIGYKIYMKIGEDDPFVYGTVDRDTFEIIIDDIIQGVEYSFAVSSFNVIGEGKMTVFKSIVPISNPEPVPLVWISDVGESMVEISWTAPLFDGGAEVTGYTIFKGTTPEAPNQLATGITGLTYIDEDVITGRTYYYRIRAENGESSEKSHPVEARPSGDPGSPQIFEADPSTDQVTLTWLPPDRDGGDAVTGYILMRGDNLEDLEVIAHLGPNVSEYVDKDVSAGKYLYRLQAINDNGIGDPADMYVDVPSRTLYVIMAGAVGIVIPLFIVGLVLVLPGVMRRRKEAKEKKKKEAEEEEMRIRRMRAEEMAARGLPGKGIGAPALGGMAHQAPALAAPSPMSDGAERSETEKDKADTCKTCDTDSGYIRPSERKKKEKKDRSKVLRSDGKSLEHREKEEELRHTLRSRDDHRGKHWEEKRRKILEEEARKVFTGQQTEEHEPAEAPEPAPEPPSEVAEEEKDTVPTVEDVLRDVPVWGEGEKESDEIPTWDEDEGESADEIPLAKEPEIEVPDLVSEDIEEMEELEELEELDEYEE
ncbi:MAG: fibronectin type III domain-containing protein [Thermoplasmatota archaeon]